MIFLSKHDIGKLTDRKQLISHIEQAFELINTGGYSMPDRISLFYEKKNFLFMPCFMPGALGTKILTVYPENYLLGKPLIQGVVILFDYENGELSHMLDGQTLTALRTAAVGSTAVKHLAPIDAQRLGIVGTGIQGFNQAISACTVRDIRQITLFDQKPRAEFVTQLQQELGSGIEIAYCDSAEQLLAASDIVITTTNAGAPVLPNDAAQLKGKCIVAIGSYTPQMREIPDAIWDVVDQALTELPFACEESGDFTQPLEEGRIDASRIRYMGEYLSTSPQPPTLAEGKTSYFKSVGVGLFDLICAKAIADKATEQGVGQLIEM